MIGREVLANPDVDGAVGSGFALVHDISSGENAVEFEDVVVADGLELGFFFHVAQPGEVVGDFAFRAGSGSWDFLTFFEGSDFLQGEGIAFDGSRGVDVAGAGVFLEGGNPRQIDTGSLNLFTEGGNGLHVVEQGGADLEFGGVAHGVVSLVLVE